MPLGKNADAGDYVKDFAKSDAPQFKGKSKEKRRKMAIAAYLDSKDKKESKMKSFDDLRAELQEVNVDRVKRRIDQEKKRDELKHDRMLNRARMRDKRMNDELDHNDKPFVKDLVKKLRGGSKTHAKQADDLEKALKEVEEVKPHMMYDPKTGKGVMAKDKADHDRLNKMGYTHDKPEVKEISSNKLGNYMRKSAAAAAKPGASARTQDKRIAGQSMADKKIRKKMGYSSDAKVPAGKNEAKQTHMFDNEKDARAKAKEIGGKYVKGTGKSAGKHAAVKEGVIGAIGRGIKKVASPVTNRLTRAGRAGIAQKKIDKHNKKVDQQDTIKRANDAGKSAFGLTRKSRAANAQKKLDKLAKKKAQQDTINRAKNMQRGVSAGMEYEDAKKFATADKMNYKKTNMKGAPSNVEEKKMDSAAMKKAMDVFKKRGGKITKVAPGKAAGYHGKDDPGKDMKGMMDKGDTKSFKKNKFVRSMK